MAPWWTHRGSSSTLDATRYCFVAPSSWFDSLPSGFSLAPMGFAVLHDGAIAAHSNASVGASFAANSAFSNDSLASTRSIHGWTTTLSTPFSSCHGKHLNLKREEVCAQKQLFVVPQSLWHYNPLTLWYMMSQQNIQSPPILEDFWFATFFHKTHLIHMTTSEESLRVLFFTRSLAVDLVH
jgi:hypothetical protein